MTLLRLTDLYSTGSGAQTTSSEISEYGNKHGSRNINIVHSPDYNTQLYLGPDNLECNFSILCFDKVFKLLSIIFQCREVIIISHLRRANILGYFLSLAFKANHIIHIHGDPDLVKSRYSFIRNIHKKSIKSAYKVICNSDYTCDTVFRFTGRVNLYKVYNGIYLEKNIINPLDAPPHSKKIKRLVCVGVDVEIKNTHLILKDFNSISKKISNYELVIVGGLNGNFNSNGEDVFKYFKENYNFKKNDQVIFMGHVDNVDSIIKNSHALISRSEVEGFSRVVALSMGYGVPVITYPGGAPGEYIKDKVNGLFYKNDIDLLNCLEYLQVNSNYSIISTLSKKFFKKEFDFESQNSYLYKYIYK
jgi:glycosyltransferase involved in cell wall biosynthesis